MADREIEAFRVEREEKAECTKMSWFVDDYKTGGFSVKGKLVRRKLSVRGQF